MLIGSYLGLVRNMSEYVRQNWLKQLKDALADRFFHPSSEGCLCFEF